MRHTVFKIFGLDCRYRTGEVDLFLGTITHDNSLLKHGSILGEDYSYSLCSSRDAHRLGHIAQRSDFQSNVSARDLERKGAVQIRHSTVACPLLNHCHSHKGFSGLVHNLTGDGTVLGNCDEAAE